MFIAGVFFIVGVILNAAALNIEMLIIGRILLGCGVGFANQVCALSPSFFFPPIALEDILVKSYLYPCLVDILGFDILG